MREVISISAIIIAFFYFLAFGASVFVALDTQMHWALALMAFAWIILLRLWFALPVLAFLGADGPLGWEWYWALCLAAPIAIYVITFYWTRFADYWRRPISNEQGV